MSDIEADRRKLLSLIDEIGKDFPLWHDADVLVRKYSKFGKKKLKDTIYRLSDELLEAERALEEAKLKKNRHGKWV